MNDANLGARSVGLGDVASALRRDGFAHVAGVFSDEDVASPRLAIAEILAGDDNEDVLRDDRGIPRKICYPLSKSPRLLPMLAHPGLGRVVEATAGGTEVALTWEDILLKPARVGAEVVVHQDLALQRGDGLVFSIGIHLHDAADNPVWFLPGSHVAGPLTRDEVRRLRAERVFTPVAPLAGDLVVHDVHCVHFSEQNRASTRRDTWYLEFRNFVTLLRDGPWSPDWARRRRAVLFHAAAARESAGQTAWWPHVAGGWERARWLRQPLDLCVRHVCDGVQYDTQSPYYHFD